jgi:NAD(P)-dependent dehydrogenase (short-subunit alcohol dehydrogenase family)
MKDKIVIITGASSGIGKALAFEFGNKGAKVVLASRNIKNLLEIVNDLDTLGITALAVKTDVTSENDCRILIDKTIEKFGRIDVLVNNAGISMRALLIDMHLDVMRKVMDTNYWGTVYCTKFAIRGFLDSIRVENLKTGLHVLMVAPGFTTSNIRRAALLADGSAQGETPRD